MRSVFVETITTSLAWLSIVLSGVMFLVALILYVILETVSMKYGVRSGDAVEPYIGGEHPSVLSRPYVSQSNLYWGFIRRHLSRTYGFLKENMHTGRLSDWVKYMSSWFGLLVLISLIVLVVIVVMGW